MFLCIEHLVSEAPEHLESGKVGVDSDGSSGQDIEAVLPSGHRLLFYHQPSQMARGKLREQAG
jgi:hypothetical protein